MFSIDSISLDAFYVLASTGVDIETGEIVDPAAEAAASRDAIAYGAEPGLHLFCDPAGDRALRLPPGGIPMFDDVKAARELRAELEADPTYRYGDRRQFMACPVKGCGYPLHRHNDQLPCQRRGEWDRYGLHHGGAR